MMKKFAAMMAACTLAFGLVACGGQEQAAAPEPENVENAVEEGETGTQKPDYTVTISCAVSVQGEAFTTLTDAAKAFNASQSDYEVDLYYGGAYNEILTVVQTSSPNDIPDLYMLSGNGSALILQDEKYYVPIQQFIDEYDFNADDIMAYLGTNYKKNGEWQVLPWGISNAGQYWNEDVLSKVGLTPEDMDSYEDILDACDKLSAAGYKNFYGMYQMRHNDWMNYTFAAEDIDYCDNDNARGGCPTKYLFMDDEKCHEAALSYFTFLREMISRGYATDFEMSENDTVNAFAEGDVVVVDNYTSRANSIMDAVGDKFSVGYQPSPTIFADTVSKGQAGGGNCLFIGRSGNEWTERGAWEFVKYLFENAEINAEYALNSGYSPVTYSAVETEIYQNYITEVFPDGQKVIEAQKNTEEGIGYAPSPVQSDVLYQYQAVVKEMNNNPDYTAEEALEEFTAKANETLELYRITNGLE